MSSATLLYAITAFTYVVAMLSGWSLIASLEKEGVIKKKISLRSLPWIALMEYYKMDKKKNGKYGVVGQTYIISICALIVEGVTIAILLW